MSERFRTESCVNASYIYRVDFMFVQVDADPAEMKISCYSVVAVSLQCACRGQGVGLQHPSPPSPTCI